MQIKVIPPTEPEFELKLSRNELRALVVLLGHTSWSRYDSMVEDDEDFDGSPRLGPALFTALHDGMRTALNE